jgi:pyruvate dehydrogenase E2 component (dihydrolipoamide acetyltransferase)
MTTEIKLPALGENVDSGTVVKVLVSAGDTVTTDQPVVDLETDKASVEVPASASGTVKEIRVKEGDTVKVGQVLLTLEEAAAETKEVKPQPTPEEAPRKSEAREAPEARESEAALQETAEAQEAKEKEKPESVPPAGAVHDRTGAARSASATARSLNEGAPVQKRQPEVVRFPKQEPEPSREVVPAAPNVRRMARELGVDINEVTGSGREGRISEEDVRNYARSIILNSTGRGIALQRGTVELPDFTRWGEIERKPMSGVRRKTAEHLAEAWASIPHVTHFDAADITDYERLRQGFGKKVEEAGGKLTITAVVLKIVAAALKAFPQFNTTLDLAREEIIHKKYYNIGVAVDTDRGLLVPVIRDVDRKNILELAVELTQVAEKTRNKKLAAEEMQGGTFTITNLGAIGGSAFTPIINSPEVAILGMARASHQAMFSDGEFKPRLMLPLALSFDHRVIDGADAARFLRWVAEALEEPFKLTMEG